MSVVTLEVPARLAGCVHRSLVALYAAGAEMVEDVLRRRAELAALDDVVGCFGWLLGGPAREVTLTAGADCYATRCTGRCWTQSTRLAMVAEATSSEMPRSTGFSTGSTS